MHITKPQADALIALIKSVRPEWSAQGIENALLAQKVRHLEDLTTAAIRVACNPDAKTPALIGFDGPHWDLKPVRTRAGPPTDCERHPGQPETRCAICPAEARPMPPEVAAFKSIFKRKKD